MKVKFSIGGSPKFLKLKKNILTIKFLGRNLLGEMSRILYLGKIFNIKHSGAGFSGRRPNGHKTGWH